MANDFPGTLTALVTPFRDGNIDFESFKKLLFHQISSSVKGLVLLGTTGEAPTLSQEERAQLITLAREQIPQNKLLIVGTTTNNTQTAIKYTIQAMKLGADATISAAPYYNKPTPEGLYQHFSKIAESTHKPIVLYSIPSRCGIDIPIAVMARLHQAFPHIIGVKEVGGNLERVSQIKQTIGESFLILSGEDSLTLPFIATGASGVVSVASNLLPQEVSRMVELALGDAFSEARYFHQKLYALFHNLICLETNPAPIKYVLWRAGFIASPEVRLPLVSLTPKTQSVLNDVLDNLHELCLLKSS